MSIKISSVNLSKFQEFETARTLKIQKRRPNLDQNYHILTNNHEKTNKKGGKKKEDNIPKPLPYFSSSFVFITHHHLHKQKNKTARRRFGALPAPSSRLKF